MAILEGVPPEAAQLLGFSTTSPGELMLSLQIVPPPAIRPSNFVGDSKVRSENDLTMSLQEIVRSNLELQDLFKELPEDAQRGLNS
jgi:DNA-directed RNA polymerase beta' subunit